MTFSLTGVCRRTGMAGVAVTSSSMAVASRCAYGRAGVGAVASQNITDPRLGPRGLDLMAGGLDAEAALEKLLAEHELRDYRQLALVDSKGGSAVHSGAKTLGRHATAKAAYAVAAGNLLSSDDVPEAMLAAFQESEAEHLAERLVRALEAGLSAGGEEGPVRSAGVLVYDKVDWPPVDLRVDWSDGDPIADLRQVWKGWRPQMDDYVTRALDPASAPAYGVPGDP